MTAPLDKSVKMATASLKEVALKIATATSVKRVRMVSAWLLVVLPVGPTLSALRQKSALSPPDKLEGVVARWLVSAAPGIQIASSEIVKTAVP